MNKIVALSAFRDNYIWAVHSLDGSEIVVVDPGDADPVLDYIQKNNLNLTAILVTHHHWDHSGGVGGLLQKFPQVPVYGKDKENYRASHLVSEGNEINFPAFSLTLRVLEIPGHTLDHVAYVGNEMLFCGDTLFSCGCGKIFEGTPDQMYKSLQKLKDLPPKTLVYCGHEYTVDNIAFAMQVEPHNSALEQRLQEAKKLREKGLPTLPVTIAEELETNPFLRTLHPHIIQAVKQKMGLTESDPVSIFANLRQWKNNF